ncbi:MAG: response regulator transcription factor [Clostridiaceae bacterium]|nr:response regulator transcription factor [Clostridiaceae bacterium]
MKRILIAEDEPAIREGLVDLLESEGYAVTAAADGEAAVEAWNAGGIDLALLDIMMPRLSGYDVCREIRKRDTTLPIVFLSAREEEIDKVLGLELGADDYVVKPFGVRELVARVKAALRRAELGDAAHGPAGSPEPFSFGDCLVDPARYTLTVSRDGGESVHELGARELGLLRWFYDNPETVHSRDSLLERFWGISYGGTTRTLDQHIAKLRQKIEHDTAEPRHILTVHGTGYRFMM